MDILGYIGYAVLIFLAVVWTIFVRIKLDAGVHTITGALFFLVAAIVLGVLGANKIHSLWIIPSGYILSLLLSILAVHLPPVFSLFRFLASAFAGIIRIGIPAEKIKVAQDSGLKTAIDEWFSKREKKDK